MANNTTNITTVKRLSLTSSPQDKDIAVLLASCAIGIIANLFVIYLISTKQLLKTVTNVFVFSICLCNVLVSAVLLPMRVFMGDSPDPVYNLAYNFINVITILIYICNLTAVSYDRLLSITQPMLYTLKQPRRRAIIIVFCMWVIPILYGHLPLFWVFNLRPIRHTIHRVYLTTTLVVFLLGPLFFIIYVYFRVCIEMKRMSILKMRLMTPNNKKMNIFKREKTKNAKLSIIRHIPNNILLHMGDENQFSDKNSDNNSGRDESESFSINISSSRSTSFSSWSIPPTYSEAACKGTSRKLTETSTMAGEMLPMLLEHQDLSGNNDNKCDVKTTTEDELTTEKVSVVTIDEHPSEKISLVEIDDKPCPRIDNNVNSNYASQNTSRNTSASNSIFSNSTTISPLHRKRESSISRMKHKARELKLSLAFLIVAITYMFTWLPVVALTFEKVLERYVLPESLVTISLYAIAINALTDPFLYGLLLPNFRKTLKVLLSRLKRYR